MVNAKNDRYLSQWKYLSFFGIACCIDLYIIVVEKLLYEYRPKARGCFIIWWAVIIRQIRWFVQFDFKTEAHQVYPDLSIYERIL